VDVPQMQGQGQFCCDGSTPQLLLEIGVGAIVGDDAIWDTKILPQCP
jgi:hypothetical protein